MLKELVSPVLDVVGNSVLTTPVGDLGVAHRHGPRDRKAIALTFDDGPVPGGTEDVLHVLDEYNVPGTFFVLGVNVLMHPDIVRRAFRAGHTIGAHSMNHSRIATVSLSDTTHLDACVEAIEGVLGRRTALYRPPWGWMTPWEVHRLRSRGLELIRWDVETPDSLVPCPPGAEMFTWTLPRIRPGSIVVCHDGMVQSEHHEKPETVRLLRMLIPALRDQGYTFVSVPDLLNIHAYQS